MGDALHWALLLMSASTACASTAGCHKEPMYVPVSWYADVDVAFASGKAQDKPVVVYFGATWDTAAKELEYVTFRDPEVSWLLRRDFVSIHVDSSDDELPMTRELQQRFKVVGDPTIVIMASDGVTELARLNEFVRPPTFARILRAATLTDAAQEAHYAARERKRLEEERADEVFRRYERGHQQGPTVIIPLPD